MSMPWAGIRSGAPVVVSLLAVLAAAAGCGNERAEARFAASSSPSRAPAAAAGGACYMVEYDVVEQTVGTSFDLAASSAAGDTVTCALQTRGGSFPDVTLAVTSVKVDTAVFRSTVVPKGSTSVAGLGKAGYSVVRPAGEGAGPGVEVGWLTGDGRLLVLRYRCAPEAPAAEAAALVPKVTALAKKVDESAV
jgi:hypothetical protein